MNEIEQIDCLSSDVTVPVDFNGDIKKASAVVHTNL